MLILLLAKAGGINAMNNDVILKNPVRGKSKKTVIIADAISGIETAILSEIQNGGAVPHQRILSRQKLARLLGASPYQIRQAVDRLEPLTKNLR